VWDQRRQIRARFGENRGGMEMLRRSEGCFILWGGSWYVVFYDLVLKRAIDSFLDVHICSNLEIRRKCLDVEEFGGYLYDHGVELNSY
jgi:hypothetical protein